MSHITIESTRYAREVDCNAELWLLVQQQADQMAREKKITEEACVRYCALMKKDKRETNSKHEKAMPAKEYRRKQLRVL